MTKLLPSAIMRRGVVGGLLVVTAVAVLAVGCLPQPEQGWHPLGQDRWQWESRGELWVRGVPANGSFAVESGRGQVVRGDLVNLGDKQAVVVLRDTTVEQWELDPGQVIPLQLEGLTNRARFDAPDRVVIANPRIGNELDDAELVVVIVVDTLRADHVTAELMPGILEYFADGRRWSQATANAPWTLPSVVSYFSSRPVLDLTAPTGDLIGIPAGVGTWSLDLEAAGFTGAAVVANYSVSVLNGFGEGFSSYLVPDGHGGAEYPDASWVVDAARNWLNRHRGENAFLYLHLMDPHFPYRNHEDPSLEPPDLMALAGGRRQERPGERELLTKLYAGEVRHVDRVLAPFLRDLPEHAVVVLTADHGESLGERDCWGHGLNLYQESLLVPLFIRAPGIGSGEVKEPVELLDLAPTILAAVQVPASSSMAGRSLFDGGSNRPIVSSTFAAGPLRWSWRHADDKVLLRMAEQPGLGEVARSKMAGSGPREPGAFVFDLSMDPAEQSPQSLTSGLVDPVFRAFIESAGRMVPGLQIGLSRRHGTISTRLEIDGKIEVVQAWSAAPMMVDHTDGQLVLECEDAYPMCILATNVEETPSVVSTGAEVFRPQDVAPPDSYSEGLSVWWNPPRPLVVGGYEETLDRLRALGYIE